MNDLRERFNALKTIGNQKNSRKKISIQIIAILITVVSLYFAFRGIDWRGFISTILSGRYILLPLVILISSANYFMRALRWRVLLLNEKKIPPAQVFWANMSGYLGNAIFPARAGEVIRAIYLGNQQGINSSFVFATCLIERLGDVFALVLIGAISVASMGLLTNEILKGLLVILFVGILGLTFILLLPRLKQPILKGINKISLLKQFQVPFEKFVTNLTAGFQVFRNRRTIVYFVLFTTAIWLIDALGFMLGASIFHLSLTLPISLVTLAAMGLASAIPSTPGYVGVYQFVVVAVLVPLGYKQEAALAFITAGQIIGFVVVLIWGGIGMMRFPVKMKQTTEANLDGKRV